MPGYRLRLPVKVHPVSAGVKGGLVGGLVMPLPALAYGVLSGHGIWWPVNLLAGMVLPGVGDMSIDELEQFHPALLVLGICIHVFVSLILGLIYGVLMPTLPDDPQAAGMGRTVDAVAVDCRELLRARRDEPGRPQGHRVAVVRCVAIRLRRGGGGRFHAV